MNELEPSQPSLPMLGEFTNTSWIAPPDMTYEEWEATGKTLQTIQGAVNWWIGDWLNAGETNYGDKYAQAIDLTGKSYETINQCKWVSKQYEFIKRLINLEWGHHLVVAVLDLDERTDILEWAIETDASVSELRSEKRRRKRAALLEPPPIPGKYRVFYADPPWQYSDSGVITSSDNYGRAERHYPTESIEGLCDLGARIGAAAEDEAVLFLWVTSPILPECFAVIEAWGFEYKSSFVWDKIGHNYGHYNSVRHEMLLVCTKGSYLPENTKLYDSVISIEKSRKHSEKPKEFRAMIDDLYPSGNRIELFARNAASGWEVWGNEPTR